MSPGYIITDMIEEVPKELSDQWIALTPAKRMGEAYELKGVRLPIQSFFLSLFSSFLLKLDIAPWVDTVGRFTRPFFSVHRKRQAS